MLNSMLSVPDLLHSLTTAGLSLVVDGDELRVKGDCHSLSQSQRQALTNHKAILVSLLTPRKAEEDRLFDEAMQFFDQLVTDIECHTRAAEKVIAVTAPMRRPCDRCNGNRCYLAVIHDGQSLRRDCAQCGRFVDFPTWYDKQDTDLTIAALTKQCTKAK